MVEDVALHQRLHQHGDVHVPIHVFPDPGGADGLVELGQGDEQSLAAELCRDDLPVALMAQEHDVVEIAGAARGVRAIGGGIQYHIAAGYEIELPAGEQVFEPLEVPGIGDVHGDLVREQAHVHLVRHAHGGDLPAAELGDGMLAPGELVDGQEHLEAHVLQLPDDPLVPRGEGIEGPREEGHGPHGVVPKGHLLHPAFHQEAVEMVEHCGPGEEDELPLPGLAEQAQQLFRHEDAEALPPGHGQGGIGQDLLAQDRQRGLVDGIAVMGHPGEEDPQYLMGGILLRFRQHRQKLAQGVEAGRGRPLRGGADEPLEIIQTFRKLLPGQADHQGSQIFGNEHRYLVLAGLQLADQVHDHLVLLVEREEVDELQHALPRPLTDGKMLADGEEVGKVHGGVEGVLRMEERVVHQGVHLGELDDPVDGGLEIAEIQAGHLELRRIGRRKTASDPQGHVSYGAGRAVRKGFCAKVYVLPACLVQQRQHVLKAPEHQHLHGLVRVGQEAQQPIHQRRQPVLLENVQRHVGQAVHQGELGGSLRFLQALQERF